MKHAAFGGHLEIVKHLNPFFPRQTVSFRVMEMAAMNGYLPVVQFLAENRVEQGTLTTVDSAARNGHFDVVKNLATHGMTLSTGDAVLGAADSGHYDIVKYLLQEQIPWVHHGDLLAESVDGGDLRLLHLLVTHKGKSSTRNV